jgi:multiple sugar transport system permease protein
MQKVFRLQIGNRMSGRLFATVMVLPSIIVLALLFVYPLILAIRTSFYKIHLILPGETFVGINNYINVIRGPDFWASLERTAIWTVSVLVIQLVLGVLISMLLNQDLFGRNLARGLVLFPWLVPAVVAAIVWRYMFNPLIGVANYLLYDVMHIISGPIMWLASPKMAMIAVIVVGVWKWLPFMVIMFLARLQTIPVELYDAAKVDGANAWQQFGSITFPWLKPVIIVAMLLRSIWLFNHFDLVYLMAYGGPVKATTTVPLLVRDEVFAKMQLGNAAALSMIMTVIMVIVSIIYFSFYGKAEEQIRY